MTSPMPSDKLHLGCGKHCLPGWLNCDLKCDKDVYPLDVRRKFRFAANTFSFAFSEHLIEHLDYRAGLHMIRETFRVLKPEGVFRVATPDLAFLLRLYRKPQDLKSAAYVHWSAGKFLPPGTPREATFVFNHFVRAWGHRFIYDEYTLRQALESVGFHGVKSCAMSKSDHSALSGLENVDRLPAGFLELETMIFEATKPPLRT
jgi:predicted SAM-dependent methyltransferase